MFNAEYFNTHLLEQIRELGAGSCSVAVHLTDGEVFTIAKYGPDGAKGGYVLFEVYPQEGVTQESKAKRRKPGGTDEVFFDRIAIPYEHITRVFLTVTEREEEEEPRFIGFPTQKEDL